ncbi:putative cyclin-D1-binding protein [Plasmopara halstedii]
MTTPFTWFCNRRSTTQVMANSLTSFDAQLHEHLNHLEQLQEKNKKQHCFQPAFWLQQTEFDVARDVFVATAQAIGHTVTKFSLVYSKKTTPTKVESASICEALGKPCEQLLAATNVALFCGAGPSLAAEILSDAIRLIKSLHSLVKAIEKGDLDRIPQFTGQVWEYSTARVSKSNCVASKRSMLQCITMLNSTIDELNEFLVEQTDDNGQVAALDEVEQEDEFGFDSKLTEEERTLFQNGLKLLTMSAAIMKRGVLTLKKLTISNDQDAYLKWTAKIDVSYSEAQDAIVDFGAALYPPIGMNEIADALNKLSNTESTILACLKEMPELTSAEEEALVVGETAFAKQIDIVKSNLE